MPASLLHQRWNWDTEKLSHLHQALHKVAPTPQLSLLTTDHGCFSGSSRRRHRVVKSCFRGFRFSKCRATTQSTIPYSRPYVVPTTLCLHVCLEKQNSPYWRMTFSLRSDHWAPMKSLCPRRYYSWALPAFRQPLLPWGPLANPLSCFYWASWSMVLAELSQAPHFLDPSLLPTPWALPSANPDIGQSSSSSWSL